ncbi:isopeptide-forming domain-containing fimbrial protein [Bombilactobacillus folatiphilus]|uniref:Isopeptide-forming domain-containing fimbrial protein n=1 Tax=Bombilactobacillus folatiphilus TaxID=2923362 RepID=A0ABY4P9I4_9LACO|nr:isopeptide-forming domain-containing fimbrial protein [Bombilactobacillus folatiphilus]UQS82286.1 isopeptide-forming domain-containing fimbrial protein [Bombilactobacillus folatiphilus]
MLHFLLARTNRNHKKILGGGGSLLLILVSLFFLVSIHNIQAKVSTKTAPPEITPNLIDDGFNSPEYTQEEQTVSIPDGYSQTIANLQLANNLVCDWVSAWLGMDHHSDNLASTDPTWFDGEIHYYYSSLDLHDASAGISATYNLFSAIDDQNVDEYESLTNIAYFDSNTGAWSDLNGNVPRKKFYMVKDQTGHIKALKWLHYSVKSRINKGNIPSNALLMEELITPSKTASTGVNYQLLVKNVSNSTYTYGVDCTEDIHYDSISSEAKALGDNQGFTSLMGTNNQLSDLTVRTKVDDGPNRYFAGHSAPTSADFPYPLPMLFQGTNFSNYVGQEAGNYPAGTALDAGRPMSNFYLLWPLQKIAPQETQRHNVEFELEVAGKAKPVLTQSYSNPRLARLNYQGDKLNLQVKLVNNGDGQGKLYPFTFNVNLPKGLTVTKEDLKQITYSLGSKAGSLTGSYNATTRQLKISGSGGNLVTSADQYVINLPVTISDDAPIGDTVVKTSFSGQNRDTAGRQNVTANATDLKIPITSSYAAKLISGVKNVKNSSDYASSATYVPSDTLAYHVQYQLNGDNEYALKSPVMFNNSNAGLDFSDSAPSVTVNGDNSVASAAIDHTTGKITVTKANGNFSPGDLIDLTYNAKAKADPVAGESGC